MEIRVLVAIVMALVLMVWLVGTVGASSHDLMIVLMPVVIMDTREVLSISF